MRYHKNNHCMLLLLVCQTWTTTPLADTASTTASSKRPVANPHLKASLKNVPFLYDNDFVKEYKGEVPHHHHLFSETTGQYIKTSNPFEYRILHYYSPLESQCADCLYFQPHYQKLAKRMNEITQSSHNTMLKVSVYAISCLHYPEICQAQGIISAASTSTSTTAMSNLPAIRLYPSPEAAENQPELRDAVTNGIPVGYQSIHPFQVMDRFGLQSILMKEQLLPIELEEPWTVKDDIQKAKTQQKQKSLKQQKQQHHHHHHHHYTIDELLLLQQLHSTTLLARLQKRHVQLEQDIYRVVDNFLRNYIVRHNGIGQQRNNVHLYTVSLHAQKSLKDFLQLLHQTLPPSWPIHQLFKNIMVNMVYAIEKEGYLIDLLNQYQTQYNVTLMIPVDDDDTDNNDSSGGWSAHCTKQKDMFRILEVKNNNDNINNNHNNHNNNNNNDLTEEDTEYTCGFWEMLNTIAIGLVRYNSVAYDSSEQLSLPSAVRTIRKFVEHFHGAGLDSSTRYTLLYMLDTCANDACQRILANQLPGSSTIKDWIQLPLWLLEAQNAIRIQNYKRQLYYSQTTTTSQQAIIPNHKNRKEQQKDENNDDDILLVQYPSITDCPNCWSMPPKGSNHGGGSAVATLNNPDMIYQFLKMEYGPQDNFTELVRIHKTLFAPPPAAASNEAENEASSIPMKSAYFLVFVVLGFLARGKLFFGIKSSRHHTISSNIIFGSDDEDEDELDDSHMKRQ